jgi:hypothetical protein
LTDGEPRERGALLGLAPVAQDIVWHRRVFTALGTIRDDRNHDLPAILDQAGHRAAAADVGIVRVR